MHTNITIKRSKFFLLVSTMLIVTLVISNFHKKNTEKKLLASYSLLPEQSNTADFYKKQCGFCHTSEELIAPDMKKIKATYLEKYKTKDAFVQAIIKFVKNPDKKAAIYKDGIENFMDMPKMPFKDEQIKSVAGYIFENSDL